MNERIQELAQEAGFMLWGKETWNPGDVVDWSARYDEELERFAKLLIKECVEVVKWTPSQFPNDEYVKNIKEHFGVEE